MYSQPKTKKEIPMSNDDNKENLEIRFDDLDDANTFEVDPISIEDTAEPVAVEQTPDKGTEEVPNDLKAQYDIIYDALMFEGSYKKTYSLGKSYSVTLITRSSEDDNAISRKLDGMNFQTVAAFNNMSAIFTLAHSMVELNGKDMSEMSVTTRMEKLHKLPSPLLELLSLKLIDFDQLVRGALNYGSENF